MGGIGLGVAVLGIGSFTVYRNRVYKPIHITNVYPNPFQDRIQLELNDKGKVKKYEVRVFNIKGRLVDRRTSQQSEASFDLGHLPRGPYVLQVIGDDGTVDQIKMIKN